MNEPTPPYPPLESGAAALRHFLLSLVYRFEHVTGDAPDGFGAFEAGAGVRTPARIVRHMAGLMRFAHENLGGPASERLEPLSWEDERRRFFASARALDESLARGAEASGDIAVAQMWQGPMVDAMTHVGQIATLRRLAGSPVGPSAYWRVVMPPLDRY